MAQTPESTPPRRTTVAVAASLVQRCAAHGSQSSVVSDALRAFLAAPDERRLSGVLSRERLQSVPIDRALVLQLQAFALDLSVRRGRRMTQRSVLEDILRAHLDALDALDAPPGA